jgi:cytidylate kinase
MSSFNCPVIAIDGPSASGKGTVAQKVATALGWHYLDSGALYRLTALAALNSQTLLDDEPTLAALASVLPVTFLDGGIFLNGSDVSHAIRTEAVGAGASKVAVYKAVRVALLERQRAFRQLPGLVADGRDMGSVVFTDAGLKIYLTASASVRAERRTKQLMEKGETVIFAHVLQEIEQRDARDKARAVAPLQQLPDAIRVDTSNITVDEAVQTILQHWRQRQP